MCENRPPENPRQGSLFNDYANQPPQPEPQDGTKKKSINPQRIYKEEGETIPVAAVPDLLRLHYPTIKPVEGYETFTVAIPAAATPTIWAMGRAQWQDRATTHRISENGDYWNWLGRLTCARYLGQDVETVLAAWKRGLGKGNGSECFRTAREGYTIGVKAGRKDPKDLAFNRGNKSFKTLRFVACCTVHERAAATNVSFWGVVRTDQALANLHTSARCRRGQERAYIDCLDLYRMADMGMLLPPQWLREAVLWTPGEGL